MGGADYGRWNIDLKDADWLKITPDANALGIEEPQTIPLMRSPKPRNTAAFNLGEWRGRWLFSKNILRSELNLWS